MTTRSGVSTWFVLALLAAAGGAHAQSLSNNPNGPKKPSGQVPLIGPKGVQTITQSNSTTIIPGVAISCNIGSPTFNHTDNSYYRGFTLSAFPALTEPQFLVQQVTIGVEQATAIGTQPITVRLWNATANPISGAANPPGNNQVSSDGFNVSNQALTLLPLTMAAPPVLLVASDVLAVEVFTPDGTVGGNTFFIGTNSAGQTGPSYIKAAPCGVATVTDLAAIGFPAMHIVMQVTGNNQLPVELQSISIE